MLLSFKVGFLRQDEHVATGAGALGLVTAILALFNLGRAKLIGLALGLVGWAVLEPGTAVLEPGTALQQLGSFYARSAAGALNCVSGGRILQEQYAGALAQIRADHKLPNLSGPTDVYSDEQSIAPAYSLPWSPRPVLQSHSAWSPLLERMALENGLSWLAPLTPHEAISLQDNLTVLHRPDAASWPLSTCGLRAIHRLREEVSLAAGIESETVVIPLVSAGGTVVRALAATGNRPNVAQFFHQPNLVHVAAGACTGRTRRS